MVEDLVINYAKEEMISPNDMYKAWTRVTFFVGTPEQVDTRDKSFFSLLLYLLSIATLVFYCCGLCFGLLLWNNPSKEAVTRT